MAIQFQCIRLAAALTISAGLATLPAIASAVADDAELPKAAEAVTHVGPVADAAAVQVPTVAPAAEGRARDADEAAPILDQSVVYPYGARNVTDDPLALFNTPHYK